MKIDKVPFTSSIKLVPESTLLSSARFSKYIEIANGRDMVFKSINQDIWTDGIRTCTAGIVKNSQTKQIAGFHLYDTKKNLNKLEEFIDEIFSFIPNADSALLIGGKELTNRPHSMPQFKAIREYFEKRIPNVSIFERHKIPNSESNIFYSAANDEFLINTIYSKHFGWNGKDVSSLEELLENFGEIKIGNKDYLFINGEPVTIKS